MRDNKIPFGERDGVLFRALDVENGLRCGCVCPGCKRPLNAANQGEKVSPYFRHAQSADCFLGFKEGVRRAAVAVIVEHMRLTVPAFSGQATAATSSGMVLTQQIRFDSQIVSAENVLRFVELDDVRVHAVFRNAGRELLIRIKMSSRKEHDRYHRLRALEHSSIEIDLHRLSLEQINDREAFEYFVLNNPDNRTWIRSIRAERLQKHAEEVLASEAQLLDAQWAAEEQQRKSAEIDRQNERDRLANERAAELATHRLAQLQIAAQRALQPEPHPGTGSPLEQRQNLIVATRLKAARDWGNKGLECSVCYLLSPPETRFCLYCTSDSSEMSEITVAADVANTIHHQMRSSIKPMRSITRAPVLVVNPEV